MQGSDHAARGHHQPGCRICETLRDAVPEAVLRTGLVELTLRELAAAAGVDAEVAIAHSPAGVRPHVVAAHREANERLLETCAVAVAAAPSSEAAIRDGLRAVAGELAQRPAVANLCRVEMWRDPELRAVAACVRRRYVELLARAWEGHAPPDVVVEIQLELLVGAAATRASTLSLEGRIDELPRAVEALLEVARVVEPLAA